MMRVSEFKKLENNETKKEWLQDFFNESLKENDVSLEVEQIGDMLQCEPFSKKSKFDGMIIYYENEEFEVVELMAGGREDELHVFFKTESPKRALNNFLKGNNRPRHKCLQIWRDF